MKDNNKKQKNIDMRIWKDVKRIIKIQKIKNKITKNEQERIKRIRNMGSIIDSIKKQERIRNKLNKKNVKNWRVY